MKKPAACSGFFFAYARRIVNRLAQESIDLAR
jgi:hypothetical protein